MKLSIISFTENGKRLSEKIADALEMEVFLYTKCKACQDFDADASVKFEPKSVGDWAGAQMRAGRALLFVGACGIAVRAIAPHLRDKLHDVPVLVMDEKGAYVIPILSGHMGGANALAVSLAKKIGAQAVITTATDIREKFAVDLFAKKNELTISPKDGIAKVSAKALAGEEITLSVETGHEGNLTEKSCFKNGIRLVPYPPIGFVDVVVTARLFAFDAALCLTPREYVIGMGCKRGKSAEEIERLILEKLNALGISVTQIFALASIAQKSEEQGLLAWCEKAGVPFLTYPAADLQEVEGEFQSSAFVKAQVGVDNVCERAALRACAGERAWKTQGKLVLKKYAADGMTIAIAKREWEVCLDE